MGLFRIRLSSFLAGAAVVGGYAVYQLRQDVWSSHQLLIGQAKDGTAALEARVAALEQKLAQVDK
eukprot:CAMPEP_0117680244 /NCGR_PEP_ID=MMETSP0804-20121206/18245_1 /TAXON_ID=1074897 /ORGANISM="Tetraselmis astigmatica, Strain CCMP880" /LENGTH=64 /DNA_ID=CAMNT_0005489721 /DNA_START=144 /DNA_END=338 /DNA_ORIENTATION=+